VLKRLAIKSQGENKSFKLSWKGILFDISKLIYDNLHISKSLL